MALSALSVMTAGEAAVAIIAGDARAFTGVPGIGQKTAQRIILELREKIDNREAFFTCGAAGAAEPASEAVSALCALGYARAEAAGAVSAVRKLADTAEELIVHALKHMGK